MSDKGTLIVRRVLGLVLAILISGGLSALATFFITELLSSRPATIVKAAFDADTITFRDGRIQLYFDIEKKKDCATTTTRWLWTWVTYRGESVRLYMPLGVSLTGITDIGEQSYLLSLQVPAGVWDGDWYYYQRSSVKCGGFLSLLRDEVSEIPSIPVTIKGSKGIIPSDVQTSLPPALLPQIDNRATGGTLRIWLPADEKH